MSRWPAVLPVILGNRDEEAASYAPRVRDKMSDEQRAELVHRAEQAIETQRLADEALAARDFYMIDLSDAGIGDTEIARYVPGDAPGGGMNRATVYRIVRDSKKRAAKAEREQQHRAGG